MHYKNGREAKNGDKVVLFPQWGAPIIGILYDAVAGNDSCNGNLAPCAPNDPCPNLSECLHYDDVKAVMVVGGIPDSTTCSPGELGRCYDLIHRYQAKFGSLD